ncbi:hypothetical protein [Flavisolibacter nicotianae]|uniref:hypothetical protein n=1 Tax=Flavisolibacter nicotianae TaxID=2364882 RepID=UPI0013C410E4|nr:hypothetical protein [Flavisolibacter nicotianae]
MIPYYSALLVVLGIIRYSVYYGYFSLPIKYFISAGESLLLFADEIILYAIITTIYLTITFLTNDSLSEFELYGFATKKTFPKAANSATLEKRDSFDEFIVTILPFCFLPALLIYYISNNYLLTIASLGLLIFSAIITSLIIIQVWIEKQTGLKRNSHLLKLVSSACIAALLIALYSAIDAYYVQSGRYVGTTIITNKDSLVSTPHFYFIGKTDNYSIMYNDTLRSATIIPNSEIKKFVMHKK